MDSEGAPIVPAINSQKQNDGSPAQKRAKIECCSNEALSDIRCALVPIFQPTVKQLFRSSAKSCVAALQKQRRNGLDLCQRIEIKNPQFYETGIGFFAVDYDDFEVVVLVQGQSGVDEAVETLRECIDRADAKIGYTHYVCVPLQDELAEWQRRLLDSVRDSFEGSVEAPVFSAETGKRLHLTLCMLRVQSQAMYDLVCETVASIASGVNGGKLEMELSGLGSLRDDTIIYLEVIDDSELIEELVKPLNDKFIAHEIPTETHQDTHSDYLAHVTVLRQRKNQKSASDIISRAPSDHFGTVAVDKIRLVRRGTYQSEDFAMSSGAGNMIWNKPDSHCTSGGSETITEETKALKSTSVCSVDGVKDVGNVADGERFVDQYEQFSKVIAKMCRL